MKITELSIKNFGMLSNVKVMPIDGINIFYGRNETGKSTIMAFILAMFYGVGKGEQRRRYEPWDGGHISGSITFFCGEKEYYLTRQFGSKRINDKTELWCKTTGEQLTLPERTEPGELIMGINRESFINSVYIGQAGVAVKGDNREILAKLTNLAATGDETASPAEITERLEEAAAHLRSRRSEAVIPMLEKERRDLMEERAESLKLSEKAESLRDEVLVLKHRGDRLDSELKDLEQKNLIASQIKELRELEGVLVRRAAYVRSKNEFEKLHNQMFREGGMLTEEYLSEIHQKMDDFKQQQVVLKLKNEQLSSINERLAAIDTEPLRKLKVLKKHGSSVTQAREDYKQTKAKLKELREEMSRTSPPSDDSRLRMQNILLISGVLVVLFFLLGFLHKAFFFVAIIIAAIAGGYVYTQRKDLNFEVLPTENIDLTNLETDLHDINVRMQPVLEEMGVEDMDELDKELYHIRDIRDRKTSIEEERDAMLASIEDERQKTSSILEELHDKLKPFTGDQPDKKLLSIVEQLEKFLSHYKVLEAKYQTERDAYETAVKGRRVEDIEEQAGLLKARLGNMSQLRSSDVLASPEDLETCRGDLQKTREKLASKETELSLISYDPEKLELYNGRIKSLSEKIDHYEFEYAALQEASSALEEAFETMQKDFGPMLNDRAGTILSKLTGGKYGSVMISGELAPSTAEPEGNIHGIKQLSAGTADQVYLAMRLALAGTLSEENLPLMMDEAFAQYDDERMNDSLKFLANECSEGGIGQVLLFTCHDRVLKAAEEAGVSEGIINL